MFYLVVVKYQCRWNKSEGHDISVELTQNYDVTWLKLNMSTKLSYIMITVVVLTYANMAIDKKCNPFSTPLFPTEFAW